MSVTLINVFSVPKGNEDEFMKWWEDIKNKLLKEPGIISGKFHRSIKPESRFNFVNVAVWENEDVFAKAIEKIVTPLKPKLAQMGAEMTPALYHVAFEY